MVFDTIFHCDVVARERGRPFVVVEVLGVMSMGQAWAGFGALGCRIIVECDEIVYPSVLFSGLPEQRTTAQPVLDRWCFAGGEGRVLWVAWGVIPCAKSDGKERVSGNGRLLVAGYLKCHAA